MRRYHRAVVQGIADARLGLDVVDGPVGGGMAAHHVRHYFIGKPDIMPAGREDAFHIRFEGIDIGFVDGAPQRTVFLQRLHRLADVFFEKRHDCPALPTAHFGQPERVGEMVQGDHGRSCRVRAGRAACRGSAPGHPHPSGRGRAGCGSTRPTGGGRSARLRRRGRNPPASARPTSRRPARSCALARSGPAPAPRPTSCCWCYCLPPGGRRWRSPTGSRAENCMKGSTRFSPWMSGCDQVQGQDTWNGQDVWTGKIYRRRRYVRAVFGTGTIFGTGKIYLAPTAEGDAAGRPGRGRRTRRRRR